MKEPAMIRSHLYQSPKALRRAVTGCLCLLVACAAFQGSRPSTTYYFQETSYYYGTQQVVRQSVGFFPVTLDVRLAESEWDSTRRKALLPLLDRMNEFLDSLQTTARLPSTGLSLKQAPDIFIGLAGSHYDPATYQEAQQLSLAEQPRMVLHLRTPSGKWRKRASEASVEQGVDHLLYITLGFSEYMTIQSGWSGQLELILGTGYRIPIPWLNEPEPVEVLHLTAALLDREGHIMRVGAEGIIAKKTGYLIPVLGLREGIPDYDLQKVPDETHREDLPEKSLAWKVALQNLIAGLTQQENLLITD